MRPLALPLLLPLALAAGCAPSKRAADPVTASALLAATASCTPVPGTNLYATDVGVTPTIQICALPGAYFWHADMDIDCDGGSTALCQSDPAYQPDTSLTDTHGNALDASKLPFVVVPLPGNGFDYSAAGIRLGAAAAVVYGDRVEYGVFGDEGPPTIIGEASYAMATLFGIDADPVTGGVDSGVTYVVFSGSNAVVTVPEDPAAARALGHALAEGLVQ